MKMKEKINMEMLVCAYNHVCLFLYLLLSQCELRRDNLSLEACIRERWKPYWFLLCIVSAIHKALPFLEGHF